MYDSLNIFRIADALARHSGARQAEIARNVANSDTPGFRAGDIAPFPSLVEQPSQLSLRAERAGHFQDSEAGWRRIDAPDGMSPNGNTVSLEDQMLKAVEIRQTHDLALGVYATSLSILRTSLGGRG